MKFLPLPVIRWAVAVMAFSLVMLAGARAQAGELKYEAVLVWGTNSEKSPDPNHKLIEGQLDKKLKKAFKWEHYFEVNRLAFSVADGQTKTVTMSKICDLQVRRIDAQKVEVQLFGKKKLVGHITQNLPKGECLVTGGDAADSTGWFVVLRQID
jgi:hypothetical protein